MPFASFASAHALRARMRRIYALPELNIAAYGNALMNNNFYYTKVLLNSYFYLNWSKYIYKDYCGVSFG